MKVFETVPYEVKRYRRAKYIRIIIKPGGAVVVSTPWRTPKYVADRFLQANLPWVTRAREKMQGLQPLARAGNPVEYKQNKAEALAVFTARLKELNVHYQFSYRRVSVRNQKTRWGSCSKTGTLSFSYRLLFVPPEVRDYVLVHELCHVKEMNHSARFWRLVEETVPQYKLLRRQLQTYSRM